MTENKNNCTIERLGETSYPSPLALSRTKGNSIPNFVTDDSTILLDVENTQISTQNPDRLEIAGPRERLYFEPHKVHAALVTCGGLCPGLNNVIRAIVMCLWHQYGVRKISGIRYGYRGLLPDCRTPPLQLSPEIVKDIHLSGGTILGSARGYGDRTKDIVDFIEKDKIDILFTIGGDGTQKGALNIHKEIVKRRLSVAVIGIPKTIDNDLSFVERSFGFETAVSKATEVVTAAHTEARCAINGIVIVKLMGRQSGFIAAYTAIASNDVNFVLVPEIPFDMKGNNGFLMHLEKRLLKNGHALIIAAEGAGQELMERQNMTTDGSGNTQLADIGIYLKNSIAGYFKKKNIDIALRYIDPSYTIRSLPAVPVDSTYCASLGINAVHAAMSGRTSMITSLIHNHLVHVPIEMTVKKRNIIDPEGALWRTVLELTGQPAIMRNRVK